jgi:penicillin amidase
MSTRSRQATVFESWYNKLIGIPTQILGQIDPSIKVPLDPLPRFLLKLYEDGDESLGITREDFLHTAAQSFVDVIDELGPLVPRWGDVHRVTFDHPVLPDVRREVGYGGNRYTVNVAAALDPPSFDVKAGVSYRQLIDLARPERSKFSFPIGQSERVDSPFFDNLLPRWARGRYLPMKMHR